MALMQSESHPITSLIPYIIIILSLSLSPNLNSLLSLPYSEAQKKFAKSQAQALLKA